MSGSDSEELVMLCASPPSAVNLGPIRHKGTKFSMQEDGSVKLEQKKLSERSRQLRKILAVAVTSLLS